MLRHIVAGPIEFFEFMPSGDQKCFFRKICHLALFALMLHLNKPHSFHLVIYTHDQLQMTSVLGDGYFLNCFDHAISMMFNTHTFDFAKITEQYLKTFCDLKKEWAPRTLIFAKVLSS